VSLIQLYFNRIDLKNGLFQFKDPATWSFDLFPTGNQISAFTSDKPYSKL